MAHPNKTLSDGGKNKQGIKHLESGTYADGGGLYLQVDEGGSRSWLLRTMVQGKRRWMGLGGYPVVSLAEARDDALTYRKVAKQGGDPFAERDKNKTTAPTFEQAARTVHGEHSAAWRNVKHRDQWINTLAEYAFPVFGDKRVDLVDSADLLTALAPIWLTKPETARRVRQRVGAVLDWAKAKTFRSADNPVREISKALPKQSDRASHHAALPYAEVPEFIIRLREASTSEVVKLALEFLILTATRTSEVLGAKWAEINLDKAEWTIPDERMKAQRDHRVPLSPRCVAVLRRAKEVSGDSEYVFALSRKRLSGMVFLMLLRRMKLEFTVHGFRSSFKDWASEQTNFPNDVSEAALAHTVKSATEASYKRTDFFDKRRKLMETWAGYLKNTSGKVVSLRRRA